LKLGLNMGYLLPGASIDDQVALAFEAERLGFDSVWAAEAQSTDAVTVLGYLAALTSRVRLGSAVMQISGRSPANAAMTALTLDLLSEGRFVMGLGASGPQVVEGWHGRPWAKPLTRTREYVEIVRTALRNEHLEHHGEHFRIPYDGDGSSGHATPLRFMTRPPRADIPIWLGATTPRSVRLAAEIADGWLALFLDPERLDEVYGPELAGAKKGFEIAATARLRVGRELGPLREEVKPLLALYVGGMGARGRNFYKELFERYGYGREAAEIQDLYLSGHQTEAIARVPDQLVDRVALVGTKEHIRERLDAYRAAGVTTLLVGAVSVEALRTLADAAG
jgi:F420-dependent oxidoreductase-like protein